MRLRPAFLMPNLNMKKMIFEGLNQLSDITIADFELI